MARKNNITTPAQDKLQAAGIDAICALVADCVPLRTIAETHGVSFASLATFLSHKDHAEQYARAREAQADKFADDILQIADDGLNDSYKDDNGNTRTDQDVIARSRLRVDARKWLASKMAPKKYGDKLAVGGADDLPPVQVTKIVREIVRPEHKDR
jgi:hypothetical protein